MKIANKQARQAALTNSGLNSAQPIECNAVALLKLIKQLGYVQQDPLQVIARAHDHILWSRNNHYRPYMLDELMEEKRGVFEHFSHDACVMPMDSLPFWEHQMRRKNKLFSSSNQRNNLLNANDQRALLTRITNEGPLCSRDFKVDNIKNKTATWTKPAHKQTLDYLWLTGKLAVSKREKFTKYYDLASRVYPRKYTGASKTDDQRMSWLVTHALKRLSFGTHAEITHFWDASSISDTKAWCEKNKLKLRGISIESFSGEYKDALTLRSNDAFTSTLAPLSKQLKIINPFDPIVRDRKRLLRLFGFDYKIEIYVPPAKRKYGYYVYPLLEFDRFVGRIEVRHDKERNEICVDNLWHEHGIKFGKQRMAKLKSELIRLKQLCNADTIKF